MPRPKDQHGPLCHIYIKVIVVAIFISDLLGIWQVFLENLLCIMCTSKPL